MEGNVEATFDPTAAADDDFDQDEEFFGREFQLPYSDAHPFVYFYDTFVGLNATHAAMITSVQAALDPETRAAVQVPRMLVWFSLRWPCRSC